MGYHGTSPLGQSDYHMREIEGPRLKGNLSAEVITGPSGLPERSLSQSTKGSVHVSIVPTSSQPTCGLCRWSFSKT